ncbi:MAG: hypothetical protein H7256_02120 [Bdellovibrio sp.]|nr:hypothetical protein [Bdellovibrio sp.]
MLAQVQSQNIDMDVDSEIDQLYHAPAPAAARKASPSAVFTQTVVVPQQQAQVQSQQAVQKQPTTLVEASPLTESKADSIRKSRQNEEMNTETRIVEKLEQSRMEDEKRRAQVLFGDKFDALQNGQQPAVAQPVAPSPVQVAPAPQPVQPIYIEQRREPVVKAPPVEEKETLSRDAVREEVRAALDEDSKAVVAPVELRYFGAYAGIGEYPDVKNVKGNYTLGAAFGTRYEYMMIEGAFMMSNYGVDVNNYIAGYRMDSYDVNQYQGSLTAKYQMLGGMVRPVIGGTIAYSYRKYALTNSYTNASQDTGNSQAIDLGINTGVDLEFSPKFSLGIDFRYMFNMSSKITSNYSNSSYGQIGTPLEKLQYYTTGIWARVNF